MTPELLSQYKDIKQEIHLLQYDIDRRQAIFDKVQASMPDFPYIKMEIPIGKGGGMPALAALYGSELTAELQRKTLRDLEQKRDAIERFIESIELPRIRLLIRIYYIEGKSWQQCANTIQGNVTADGLRMELKRFFEKI